MCATNVRALERACVRWVCNMCAYVWVCVRACVAVGARGCARTCRCVDARTRESANRIHPRLPGAVGSTLLLQPGLPGACVLACMCVCVCTGARVVFGCPDYCVRACGRRHLRVHTASTLGQCPLRFSAHARPCVRARWPQSARIATLRCNQKRAWKLLCACTPASLLGAAAVVAAARRAPGALGSVAVAGAALQQSGRRAGVARAACARANGR